jgi:Histidinol phosphatase and related phosphatases
VGIEKYQNNGKDLYCVSNNMLLLRNIKGFMIMNGLKKAVFLDMQGTLGGAGVDDISTFEFYPFSIEDIKKLNKS